MAAPSQAQPVALRIYSPIGSRDGGLTKDPLLINGIAEKSEEPAQEGQEVIWVRRRPGLVVVNDYGYRREGRGVFNWREQIYAVFGDKLFRDGVILGTVQDAGMYTFTSCLGALPQLLIKNEDVAYNYDDVNGLVPIADADFPGTTVRGCAYLDGTTYVATPTNQIIGDDFNDQTSWDPLNVLIAQIEPDEAIAIAKQLVYVVVLKKISTEVFYDAGNATGSPLGPVQGSKSNTGCRHEGTLADVGGELMWVGMDKMGAVKVMLMEAVKIRQVSSPPVERVLAGKNYGSGCYAWAAGIDGHRFYAVTLIGENFTLVFDLESNAWYIWTDAAGNYMPIAASTYDHDSIAILQHVSDGKLYTLQQNATSDAGTDIPFTCRTNNFDGGVRTVKECASIEVQADWSNATIRLSWSDDDYQTYTTPQSISLAQERPMIQDGSSFRRRTYTITNTDQQPFRLKALQPTLKAGTF